MNIRKIVLILASGGAAALVVLLSIALVSGPTAAASRIENTPPPPDETWSSSAEPLPGVAVDNLSPPDRPSSVSSAPVGEPERTAPTSQPGEVEDGALWLSSAEPPPGTPIEMLSPPDAPPSANDPNEGDEALLQQYSYLRTTGSALRPRNSVTEWGPYWTGGCIYALNGGSTVFNTPVYLPQGATVKYVRMYFNDTSASDSMGWFTVYDLYGGLVDEWNVTSSGDTGESYQTSEEFTHTVDYGSYSYLLNWRPIDASTAMYLCGFRIYYYAPPFGIAFLPGVFRNY